MTLDVLNLMFMATNKTVPSVSDQQIIVIEMSYVIYIVSAVTGMERKRKKEPNTIFVLPRLSAIQVIQQQIMTLYDIFSVAGISLHPCQELSDNPWE